MTVLLLGHTVTEKQHPSKKMAHLECVAGAVPRPVDLDHLCDAHVFDLLEHKFTVKVQLFLEDMDISPKFGETSRITVFTIV